MIRIRPAGERGHTRLDWLDSRHTFSFDSYRDPAWMGYRGLRVLNEDRVAAGRGFGLHPHRDMEIVTWVLSGSLEHRDSLGSGSVLRPGEVQRMTAGTGIAHSEFNPSPDRETHLLQIWIRPERGGLEPSYDQRAVPEAARRDRWAVLAAPEGGGGAVSIRAPASVLSATIAPGRRARHELGRGRGAWLQVARGEVRVGGVVLRAGDGAAIEGSGPVEVEGLAEAEALLFDLG